LDFTSRTFLGFTWRQVLLIVIAGAGALVAFTQLAGVPLYVRGALAVLLAGLGLAWAFGHIEGETPEKWLLEVILFRRRSRYFLHRAIRDGADGRRVIFPDRDGDATLGIRPEATMAALTAPGFVWLSANAIGVSILTGLSLWLAQGGAQQLLVMWRRL
jgi:hypothetical protein